MRILLFLFLISALTGRAVTTEQWSALKEEFSTLLVQYQDLIENQKNRYFSIEGTCNGRLTLQSGIPVSTSDQTSVSTVYFTPFNGNRCSTYASSTWTIRTFSEISIGLSSLTSGANYDVFLYSNSGTLALELSAAWSNDTTRNNAISLQNGVYVKTADTTRRFLGTIRTTSTSTTEDSESKRFVWNYLNRVPRTLKRVDTTNSWVQASNSWVVANGDSTNNAIRYVVGLNDRIVQARALTLSSGGVQGFGSGIGVDSCIANSNMLGGNHMTRIRQAWSQYAGFPGLGYHYLCWMELLESAGSRPMYGDNNDPTAWQSGIVGEIEN